MNAKEFFYDLPNELIAQEPLKERHLSRLMVLDRQNKSVEHRHFVDILEYIHSGDLLVLNDTRVIPARLLGMKEDSGAKIEFVLLKRIEGDVWEVILKPGRKAKIGARFIFGNGVLKAEILEILEDGNRLVRFEHAGIFEKVLDEVGMIPLPPYITHKLNDAERYQTVYAKHSGSVAAPTAGLHFTDSIFEQLHLKGVGVAHVTLHIGLGTFRPVKVENILEHKMHSEYFSISKEVCEKIKKTKQNGSRVICVGTTSVRVLESVADDTGYPKEGSGWTNIFIYPGYTFKVVDSIITNFHLPESTLIMLVSAFLGKDKAISAYETAVMERYRFFSFGDAMLIK